ncbi:MAG: ABC transporter ATP-binding protein [Candidatus Cloacimonetes bacterium]|nr:ABC transporter ATP-binding protein [Candidatus Cloacimonadota bacterium]
MIEIKGLTKHYGDLAALVDMDLVIEAGDIFGFIGPNGAGKTTTMRILATLLEPSRGQAFINGLDVTKKGKKVRRIVGYMPDFMGVYDDLKVFEYLEFFAAAFGIERRKRKSIVEGVLELTDLQTKQSFAVDSLSRGMQQRLGLARVLIHDPLVLILDEPASGLDPRARIEVRELLRELKRMGKTIMISSHILSELEEICDHVGIIEQGRLVFSGTMEGIRQRMGVQSKVRVCVADNQSKAVELLSALPEIQDVRLMGAYIAVTFEEGQSIDGIIARTLVRGDIDIISLEPEQLKLDDAFLKLTEGIVH